MKHDMYLVKFPLFFILQYVLQKKRYHAALTPNPDKTKQKLNSPYDSLKQIFACEMYPVHKDGKQCVVRKCMGSNVWMWMACEHESAVEAAFKAHK